ncbi:MAG: hypothetical protein EP330_24650 [Deltaproteobacteria bacterium]|nr:MAG: hypothetical protein EP330_24650 [Deltaproteobacteria bacterium]
MEGAVVSYELDAVLGRGGSGVVYAGRKCGPGEFVKPVAVKLLREEQATPELIAMLRDEARVLGLTRDRALVSAEPPIRVDDSWAVIMELIDGVSTERLLADLGPLPPCVVLSVVGEVARCLDAIYQQPTPTGEPLRLVHRDVKPANIVLTATGVVKLFDLGMAVACLDPSTGAPLPGRRDYMPPERVRGYEGPEGDVYALGATMRRLATGDVPLGFGEWRCATRDDQDAMPELLALSEDCQRHDRTDRPSMRELERHCQRLLHRFDAPPLHDWCEKHVPTLASSTMEPVRATLSCVDPRQGRYTLLRDGERSAAGPWWRRWLAAR